ncbi:hypothetical protein A0J61_00145 [Choanephora cucurbitarum]|uniref:Uncharacterized protein n=1 Tax=Choanephora cucurbitarum TaxID=101091 RepID=A0A1C7NWI3_9FUNG|nr:hypothetical protein A0J61_00145 [Choanephora cucurbitarum]
MKDLQYQLNKIKSAVKSQAVRNNPLQNQETRSFNLWLFEECNDLASLKATAYHHAETNKALLEWIQQEAQKHQETHYSQDVEAIGECLVDLLDHQIMADAYHQHQILQDRLCHLEKSNPTSKLIADLKKSLADAPNPAQLTEEAVQLKRKMLRDAFYIRFNALEAYAERTAVISRFGKHMVDLLDENQQASSNCDMILKDALLTLEGWKPTNEDG